MKFIIINEKIIFGIYSKMTSFSDKLFHSHFYLVLFGFCSFKISLASIFIRVLFFYESSSSYLLLCFFLLIIFYQIIEYILNLVAFLTRTNFLSNK